MSGCPPFFCRPVQFLFILFFLSATFSTISPTAAQEFYAANIRPSAFEEDGVLKGYSVDIMKEVARRLGKNNLEIRLLPFRRAFYHPRNNSNVILTNLARIKGREGHFKWLYKMTDIVSFYVTNKKGVSHNHQSASTLTLIGVLSGAAVHAVLKKNTQANIFAASNETTNLKMLLAGRIDAWFTSNILMRGALLDAPDLSRNDLVIGDRIGDEIGIYAAASLDMPDEEVLKWRGAFDTMMEDGTYQVIMNQYLAPASVPSD